MRYNFPNGWFVGSEGGGLGLSMNGVSQDGAFGRALSYQGVQFGYNFKNANGLPFTVYAGFDNLKYNAGSSGPFAPFDTMSGTLPGYSAHAGVEFQPAPNSACRSGLATPNCPGVSMAMSIRSRCPAFLRLPPAVAATRPGEEIEADFASGRERDPVNCLEVESFDDFVGERHQIRR